jgi:hypothetical protein
MTDLVPFAGDSPFDAIKRTDAGAESWSAGHVTPGKAEFGGYIYVIEFTDGTIKVGTTNNPPARLAAHRRSSISFGIDISRRWFSGIHENRLENEQLLIQAARALGGSSPTVEFFKGVRFDDIAGIAKRLKYTQVDIEAARAAQQEKFQWLQRMAARCPPIQPRPWNDIIGDMFGRDQDQYNVPEKDSVVPLALVEELATLKRVRIEEVLDMDFIDLLEGTIRNIVSTEAMKLRAYAIENRRKDLLAIVSDFLES